METSILISVRINKDLEQQLLLDIDFKDEDWSEPLTDSWYHNPAYTKATGAEFCTFILLNWVQHWTHDEDTENNPDLVPDLCVSILL